MSKLPESTKRDLVLDTIAHKETGSIPYVIFFQPSISRELARYYKVDSIDKIVDNSIEWIGNTFSTDRMEELGLLKDGVYFDDWGVCWYGVGETRGQVKTSPLSKPTLKGYCFPGQLSSELIKQMKQQAEMNHRRYRIAKLGALWEQATFLRGMEALLVDLILHPAFVHDLLDGIVDVLLKLLEIYHRELVIDCIWLSDDYGTQQNLLMSPGLWHEFVRPRAQLICDAGASEETDALIRLKQVDGAFIQGCRPRDEIKTFISLEGEKTDNIIVMNNDFSGVDRPVEIETGIPKAVLFIENNRE